MLNPECYPGGSCPVCNEEEPAEIDVTINAWDNSVDSEDYCTVVVRGYLDGSDPDTDSIDEAIECGEWEFPEKESKDYGNIRTEEEALKILESQDLEYEIIGWEYP